MLTDQQYVFCLVAMCFFTITVNALSEYDSLANRLVSLLRIVSVAILLIVFRVAIKMADICIQTHCDLN